MDDANITTSEVQSPGPSRTAGQSKRAYYWVTNPRLLLDTLMQEHLKLLFLLICTYKG